jgi:hypothetical protein
MPNFLYLFLALASSNAQSPAESSSPAPFETLPESGLMSDGGVSRGVAWGDFSGDGLPDLAVANTDGGYLFLYRNLGGLRFERILSGDTADLRGDAQAVAFVDLDNDGHLDLFVTVEGAGNALFRNNGQGLLERWSGGALTDYVSASVQTCFADADRDGLLDAYIVNADHQDDAFFRNLGDMAFELVTGPWSGAGGNGRSCAWADPDNNGYPDLYVANAYPASGSSQQYARNQFFHNQDGNGFEEVRAEEFVEVTGYSYGVSWADFDQDGDEDLLVTNIARYQPDWLFENAGNGIFLPRWDLRVMSDAPGPAKGHVWADFDLDGDLDLFLAEGHGGARPEHAPFDNLNRYYLHEDGELVRHDVPGLTSANRVSAGAAAADADLDGDLDLFVANWTGESLDNEFYRNNAHGSSISVQLRGTDSNSWGIGARATLEIRVAGDAFALHRSLWLNTGYASMSEPVLHFGLPAEAEIDGLTVFWPSGREDRHDGIAANMRYIAVEAGDLLELDSSARAFQ